MVGLNTRRSKRILTHEIRAQRASKFLLSATNRSAEAMRGTEFFRLLFLLCDLRVLCVLIFCLRNFETQSSLRDAEKAAANIEPHASRPGRGAAITVQFVTIQSVNERKGTGCQTPIPQPACAAGWCWALPILRCLLFKSFCLYSPHAEILNAPAHPVILSP